jgi:hypothetical protein
VDHAVTAHPAADRVTSEALVVEQDRAVVPLSAWLLDAAATAAATQRQLQVLTRATSALTYPLALVVHDFGALWVRRTGHNVFHDGLTGQALRWTGARFAADPAEAAPEPPPAAPGVGDLELQITTLHPARPTLELGASTAAAMRALTGEEPLGWGTAEPVPRRWSPRALTDCCRDRAPDPTQLVVVGRGVIGRIVVDRVDGGVLEEIRLAGPPAGRMPTTVLEALAAELAGTVRSLLVAVDPGLRGGLRHGGTTVR